MTSLSAHFFPNQTLNWCRASLSLFFSAAPKPIYLFAPGLALGSGIFFALRIEPPLILLFFGAGLSLLLSVIAFFAAHGRQLLAILIGVLLGWASAQFRTHSVAEHRLPRAGEYEVSGRVIAISQSYSGTPRYLIEVEKLRPEVDQTPRFVRISVDEDEWLKIGDRLGLRARLSPPNGPSDPDGYNFAFAAWFSKIGAVGYARDPPKVLSREIQGFKMRIAELRQNIGDHLMARLSASTGGFSAAIVVGDRSRLNAADVEALRIANLAHLLAISGLHMGLFGGLIFGLMRYGLLAWNLRNQHGQRDKKIAAFIAIFGIFVYLLLSGMTVSAQRASIMVGLMFVAVLASRPALSLRAIVIAAIIILLFRPEMLFSAGFQMSFAATYALISVFGAEGFNRRLFTNNRVLRGVFSIALASLVAGLATAPFAAGHFNRVSHYGMLANILTVPIMGTVIMPSLFFGLIFDLIGMGKPFFYLADLGIRWIVGVAHWVSGFPKPVSAVPSPYALSLPLIAIGFYFAMIWGKEGRKFWWMVLAIGLALWPLNERPEVLIAERGKILGVMNAQGVRALSKERAQRFIAQMWLANDGQAISQEAAHRLYVDFNEEARDIFLDRSLSRHNGYIPCVAGQLVLIPHRDQRLKGACLWFDRVRLKSLATAHAIYRVQDGFSLRKIDQTTRLWSPSPK